MTTFFFLHAWALWGVPGVLAVVATCYLWSRRTRRRRLVMFLTARQARKAQQWQRERWRLLSAGLVALALALVWSALARPLSGPRPDETRAQGIDAYVLLDCSKSMLVSDNAPDRLEFAKHAVMKWRETLGGDRLGLVLIGGDAFVAIPPTLAIESFNLILSKVAYNFVQGGSNLARGIDAAVADLTAARKEGKYPKPVILLFSDGGQTSGDAVAAARAAWETHGIRVYSIGVGTTVGGRVPRTSGPYRTAVSSQLDEASLQAIARAGGGAYTHLVGSSELDAGLAVLDRLYQAELVRFATRSGRMEIEDYYEWFHVPLGLALLLLMAEPFVRNRRASSVQEPETLPVTLPDSSGHIAVPLSPRSSSRLRSQLKNLSSANLLALGAILVGIWLGNPPTALGAFDSALVQQAVIEKKYDEAERLLREALAEAPDNAELKYNLGIVAYAHARELDEAGGTHRLSVAPKMYLEAVEHFQAVLTSSDPGLVNRTLFQLGNVKTRLGSALAARDVNGAAAGADALEEALESYQALDGTPLAESAKRNFRQASDIFEQTALSFARQKLAAAGAKPKETAKRFAEQNGAYSEAWMMLQRLSRRSAASIEVTQVQREIGAKWADNLVSMARPLEEEAERLFALTPSGGKAGRSPKWNDAVKTQGRAVELLAKAAEVLPDDSRVTGPYSLAKARLVGELLDLVRENIALRGNAYDVLAGVTKRNLELAERYATPDDLRVAEAREELLAAMERAAVADGDRLVGEFERQRAGMSKAPSAHSRSASVKSAPTETRMATALNQAMSMYDKALALNPQNPQALYQKKKYAPELAEAFAAMGQSELQAAKAIIAGVAESPAAEEQPAAAGGATTTKEWAAADLSTVQLEKAMSHLENANNGLSQAQGLGLENFALQAMQRETNVLLAQLRSQSEAHGESEAPGPMQGGDAAAATAAAANAGGMPVETYARHLAKARKAKSEYHSAAGAAVVKDW